MSRRRLGPIRQCDIDGETGMAQHRRRATSRAKHGSTLPLRDRRHRRRLGGGTLGRRSGPQGLCLCDGRNRRWGRDHPERNAAFWLHPPGIWALAGAPRPWRRLGGLLSVPWRLRGGSGVRKRAAGPPRQTGFRTGAQFARMGPRGFRPCVHVTQLDPGLRSPKGLDGRRGDDITASSAGSGSQ